MENQEIEYSKSLESFIIMLNELGNYVVLEDIKSVLSSLNAQNIRYGFYEHFLKIDASNEIKRTLECLSHSSKNFINSCMNKIDERSQLVFNDLKAIRLKKIETLE